MEKIAIISLGRLGKVLYKELIELGHQVVGTYHSKPKNIPGEIPYDYTLDTLPVEILNSDIIIFNLTPSTIGTKEKFSRFLDQIPDKKLIFVSSTSVYGMQGDIDEDSPLVPDTSSGKFLKDCEQIILDHNNLSQIIRPAGLYSESMHPGDYLSGRDLPYDGMAVVNLISISEVSQLILKLMRTDIRVLNAVNTHHPNKKEYYTDYCKRKGLALPIFGSESKGDKKVLSKYHDFIISSELP